jgi:hypothetical protein
MVNRRHESSKLTYRVNMPGGQDRLRHIILYVAKRGQDMQRFGVVKLNKIIWLADFSAFAARSIPVTGRAYQRLPFGPAAVEMAPLLAEMQQDGFVAIEMIDFGKSADGQDVVEKRVKPLREPIMHWFTPDDLKFVDQAVEHYRNMTGTEASDDSHGPAWKTRQNYDPMPYESVYFSEQMPSDMQFKRVMEIAVERGWRSL